MAAGKRAPRLRVPGGEGTWRWTQVPLWTLPGPSGAAELSLLLECLFVFLVWGQIMQNQVLPPNSFPGPIRPPTHNSWLTDLAFGKGDKGPDPCLPRQCVTHARGVPPGSSRETESRARCSANSAYHLPTLFQAAQGCLAGAWYPFPSPAGGPDNNWLSHPVFPPPSTTCAHNDPLKAPLWCPGQGARGRNPARVSWKLCQMPTQHASFQLAWGADRRNLGAPRA